MLYENTHQLVEAFTICVNPKTHLKEHFLMRKFNNSSQVCYPSDGNLVI